MQVYVSFLCLGGIQFILLVIAAHLAAVSYIGNRIRFSAADITMLIVQAANLVLLLQFLSGGGGFF